MMKPDEAERWKEESDSLKLYSLGRALIADIQMTADKVAHSVVIADQDIDSVFPVRFYSVVGSDRATRTAQGAANDTLPVNSPTGDIGPEGFLQKSLLPRMANLAIVRNGLPSFADWTLAISDGLAAMRSEGHGGVRCFLWTVHQIGLLFTEAILRLPILRNLLPPDLPRYMDSGLTWAGGTGALVFMFNLMMAGGATWEATRVALQAFAITWVIGMVKAWWKDTKATSRLPGVIVRRDVQRRARR